MAKLVELLRSFTHRLSSSFVCAISFCIIMLYQSLCFATTVLLEWDSSADATGYKVYYQADSSTQPFTGTGAAEGPSPIFIQNQSTGTISATISGLDPSHEYYFAVTAYSSTAGESTYSNIVHVPAFVSNVYLTLSGNGFGTVNSDPQGIACDIGTCTAPFDNGSSLTLFATPGNNSTSLSYFNSWTGCPSASGSSCTVSNINSAQSIVATFSSYLQVHLANSSQYYSTLQTAYNYAGTSSTIQAQAVTLSGNLTTSSILNKSITLVGGYDAKYAAKSGQTVLEGTLTVAQGSIVVENIVIR